MVGDTFNSTISAAHSSETHRALPMRLWLAAPDWVFRVLGFGFFALFTLHGAQKYWQQGFWQLGPWCEIPGYGMVRMPWVPVLIDLTYLLIAISFLVRFQPKSRASDGRVILFTLLTAFAPFIFALWMGPMLGWFNDSWEVAYNQFLWRNPISWQNALMAGVLISIGNLIDVWGYLVLCRSFGIVPEARELKTSGPYRFVRHPVYLGQFLAQGGVWLFFARLHVVWIGLYIAFVAMQLYRSVLEDRALAAAFGEEYEAYRRHTFWFV
jgi:protein-S-isoprenylcysteine O-methyltransferase Ste14